jgi:hypothetical protein
LEKKKAAPPFIAPYWLVSDEADEAKANMVPRTKDVTISVDDVAFKVSVPVLQNPRAVKAGTKLSKHKPPVAKAGATVVATAAKRTCAPGNAQGKRKRTDA